MTSPQNEGYEGSTRGLARRRRGSATGPLGLSDEAARTGSEVGDTRRLREATPLDPQSATAGTLDTMGDGSVPRISADFNYGGRLETGEGITMLNPKSGNRAQLNPRIRDELVAAGSQPEEGMRVRLVRSGLNDDGRLCDMEVDARITILADGAWAAVWDWDAMEWIPSEPESSS